MCARLGQLLCSERIKCRSWFPVVLEKRNIFCSDVMLCCTCGHIEFLASMHIFWAITIYKQTDEFWSLVGNYHSKSRRLLKKKKINFFAWNSIFWKERFRVLYFSGCNSTTTSPNEMIFTSKLLGKTSAFQRI